MNKTCLVLTTLLLNSCAHSYYYAPEIKGKGEVQLPKAEIAYAIPATGTPRFSLAVLSLGIKKKKGKELLGIRMTLQRPAGAHPSDVAGDYLDPSEQVVHFGEAEFKPVYVRARSHQKDRVPISGAHEVVELLFPVPVGTKGPADIITFDLHWRVHYGANRSEAQTARFDRKDKAPQTAGSAFSDDPNYPWDVNSYGIPDWDMGGAPLWSPWPFGDLP